MKCRDTTDLVTILSFSDKTKRQEDTLREYITNIK